MVTTRKSVSNRLWLQHDDAAVLPERLAAKSASSCFQLRSQLDVHVDVCRAGNSESGQNIVTAVGPPWSRDRRSLERSMVRRRQDNRARRIPTNVRYCRFTVQ